MQVYLCWIRPQHGYNGLMNQSVDCNFAFIVYQSSLLSN